MQVLKRLLPPIVALGLVLSLGVFQASSDEKKDAKAKYTIEQIMERAHKKGDDEEKSLYKRIADGEGSKAEKTKLVELYSELVKNKPPKGEAADWKKRCDALLTAAKSVADDKAGGIQALRKAANCMECHEAHKKDD